MTQNRFWRRQGRLLATIFYVRYTISFCSVPTAMIYVLNREPHPRSRLVNSDWSGFSRKVRMLGMYRRRLSPPTACLLHIFDIRHGTSLKVGLLHFIAAVIAAQLPETRLNLGLQIGLLLTETHETHMTGQQKA